jgi:hypothetical protein
VAGFKTLERANLSLAIKAHPIRVLDYLLEDLAWNVPDVQRRRIKHCEGVS